MIIDSPNKMVEILSETPKDARIMVFLGTPKIRYQQNLQQLWLDYWDNPEELFPLSQRFLFVEVAISYFDASEEIISKVITYTPELCKKYTFKDYMDDWSVFFNERMEGF